MSKQRYEAPAVKRVRLVVKHAILGLCHTSPTNDPRSATPCTVTAGCHIPPTP